MTSHRHIHFHSSDPSEVVAEMAGMAERADGTSWLNIVPVIDEAQAAVMADRTGVAGWFTGRGSDLPLATWIPADLSRRRPEPPTLGIQHGMGSNVIERYAEHGLTLPEAWVKQQDSGKRGFVIAIPVRIAHADIIDYVTNALDFLTPVADFGLRFEADVVSTRG